MILINTLILNSILYCGKGQMESESSLDISLYDEMILLFIRPVRGRNKQEPNVVSGRGLNTTQDGGVRWGVNRGVLV